MPITVDTSALAAKLTDLSNFLTDLRDLLAQDDCATCAPARKAGEPCACPPF